MRARVTLVASSTAAASGAPLACLVVMRCIEVDTGRWRVELGGGAGIEIVLLFSRTLAFFWYCGALFVEMPVGES
jgi:hypothetical protein